jgi:surface antigen
MKRHSLERAHDLQPSAPKGPDDSGPGWLAQCQEKLGNAAMLQLLQGQQGAQNGRGSADGASGGWGQALDSHQGVTAYSNGGDIGTCVSGEFGYMYQCVEYVNRFAVQALGLGNMSGTGNARDYTSARAGLQFVPNTPGPELPQDGDILVFSGGPWGHVAVCTESSDAQVEMIQQNAGAARGTLSVLGEPDSSTVGSWGGYQLMGWQTTGRTLDADEAEAEAVNGVVEAASPSSGPGAGRASASEGSSPSAGSGSQGVERVVVPGDTLWGIAAELLGDGARYREIYDANREVIGANPDLILPGQVLRLPG